MSTSVSFTLVPSVPRMREEDLSPAEILEETDWPSHLREKPENSFLQVMPSDLKEQHRQHYSVIGQVMSHLSHEERRVVKMRVCHNTPWAEIASQLGMTVENARRHHTNAVSKMRQAAERLKVN